MFSALKNEPWTYLYDVSWGKESCVFELFGMGTSPWHESLVPTLILRHLLGLCR